MAVVVAIVVASLELNLTRIAHRRTIVQVLMDWCEIFAASGTLADLYVSYERTGEVSNRSALWLMHSALFLEKMQLPLDVGTWLGMDGLLAELIQVKNEAVTIDRDASGAVTAFASTTLEKVM